MNEDDPIAWAKAVAARRQAEARSILGVEDHAPAEAPVASEAIEPEDAEVEFYEQTAEPAVTMSETVQAYMDEYLAAQAEIARQHDRLCELRGGEEHLTAEDRDALENIRDLVAARYERMLDV